MRFFFDTTLINSLFNPLNRPYHYSPELHCTCKWMLPGDVLHRPTVQDILHIPQLHVVVSEIKRKIRLVELIEQKAKMEEIFCSTCCQ